MADAADPKGLVGEAYAIPGIGPSECRSILLDWALSLAAGTDTAAALRTLLARHGAGAPGHPMTEVLAQGLAGAPPPRRRGGRRGRGGG